MRRGAIGAISQVWLDRICKHTSLTRSRIETRDLTRLASIIIFIEKYRDTRR